MTIRRGDQAVSMRLPQGPGDEVDLADHIGRGVTVLLFFPLAFSSVCTDELCALRDDWSSWSELDASVFGISIDSPFVAQRFRQELELPFPLLSDFNRDASRAYGVLYDDLFGMREVSKRAAFVIDPSGTVVCDWVSEDAGVMPPLDEIRSAVAEARAAAAG